jgi:predicted Zn finger-like uncharacterized protein
MRLICPNCDAQYEIDDHAIPTEGRDVQCSACGHTWRQPHPDATPVPEVEGQEAGASRAALAVHDPADAWLDEENRWNEAEKSWDDEDPVVPAEPDTRKLSTAIGAASANVEPVRKPLKEDVAAILREEAEREARTRRAEAGSLESQGDLGLDASPPPGRSAPQKSGFADPFGDDEGRAQASGGKSRLPDIEEISTSLSPPEYPEPDDEETAPAGEAGAERNGFRRGFALTLLVGAICLAIYAFSPQIVERLPALEAPLDRYVAVIDTGRSWLDETMRSIVSSINAGN